MQDLVASCSAPRCFNCGAEAVGQCGNISCPNWLCEACARDAPLCNECLAPVPWTAYSIHRDQPAVDDRLNQQITHILSNQDCPFCGTEGTWWETTAAEIPTHVLESFLENACQSSSRLDDRDWLLSLSPVDLRAGLAQLCAPIYYCEACAAVYQDLCLEHEEIARLEANPGPVTLASVMRELARLLH